MLSPPAPGSGAEALPAPKAIAHASLARDGAWITRRAKVEQWRLRRSQVAANLRRVGPNRVLVEVTNRNRQSIEGVGLRVHFNRRVASAKIERTAVLQDAPRLRFRQGDERVDLLLPDLPARASRAYSLDFELCDRWIMSRMRAVIEGVDGYLDSDNFSGACRTLHHFFWSELCDWYLELVKPRLYRGDEGQRTTARYISWRVLEVCMRLLHPVIPFVTEEIWQRLPATGKSVMVAAWPEAEEATTSHARTNPK